MRTVCLSLSYGDVHRDVVRLGMLRHLVEEYPDLRVVLPTPAHRVREVLEETRHDRVEVWPNQNFSAKAPLYWLSELRNHLRDRPRAARAVGRLVERRVPEKPGLVEMFRTRRPSLVVSFHTELWGDLDLVVGARRRGIPTFSMVRSWDHLHKHLRVRPDTLGVPNRANHREAQERHHFHPGDVRLLGTMAFDRYFDPAVARSREDTLRPLGLDPARPVLVFGTAGPMWLDLDETHLLEHVVEVTEENPALRDVQIVCRLHPLSKLQNYLAYAEHPRVTLSFGSSSVKALGWSMSRDEVDGLGNLLRHADVVVTPASTLSIEAPLFGTPTIVTCFSLLQPEPYAKIFQVLTFNRHFGPIAANDWLPVLRSPEELGPAILRALEDRSWYAEGREAIVREYCTLTDGKSYRRVAACIEELSRA